MGQKQSIQVKHKSLSSQQQSRIEGLYEMYNQSIRLSTLIKSSEDDQLLDGKGNSKKPKKIRKSVKEDEEFLEELMSSFRDRGEFVWGEEISRLFLRYFKEDFQSKWHQSKEFFYELLLDNMGIRPQQQNLVKKSHLKTQNQQKQKFRRQKVGNVSQKDSKVDSFQEYFLKVIKQRFKFNIRSSMIVNDNVNRNQQQQINQIQTQRMSKQSQLLRMTIQQQVNFINQSIIDAQQSRIFTNTQQPQSKNPNPQPHITQPQNDDQYFLPLITKRRKNRLNKLSQQVERQLSPQSEYHAEIEMSHLPSKVKYSRHRIEASSIILPSTVFYERMNFSAKVETDQLLRIYRQLSNTIQQTINSCNLISCPLKHFLLYFEYKTSKKNITQQLTSSKSLRKLSSSQQQKHSSSTSQSNHISKSQLTHSQSTSRLRSTSFSHTQNLQHLLTTVSHKSQLVRKKRQFNTNYLLKQIKEFTDAYTEFLYRYLRFAEIEQTELENFINVDTVYGIVLRNIWGIVSWIAERGYEWEEAALGELYERGEQGGKNEDTSLMRFFQPFTEYQLITNPQVILLRWSQFLSKPVHKIKVSPLQLVKAYSALMKLKNQLFPQKYLKKIIIFYRQATKCCQGADDLTSLYEFFLQNCIMCDLARQMHIFRMKNIIEKLIQVESGAVDGAGEIVYAWTTWNVVLEMLLFRLKEYKQKLLEESDKIVERRQDSQELQAQKQRKYETERKQKGKVNQNPTYTQPKPQKNVTKSSKTNHQKPPTIQKIHYKQNPQPAWQGGIKLNF